MSTLYNFRRYAVVTILSTALACIPSAVVAQGERGGFYAGLQAGVAFPTAVDFSRRYVSYPTRCDRLLYSPSASYPAEDPGCLDHRPRATNNEFDTPTILIHFT